MRSGTYGEYYEDCFIIKLNIDVDFANLGNSDDADHYGTFIHEYFHFLQNMSTTYGNMSMAVFYAKIRDILYKLANNENNEMSRIVLYSNNIQDYIIKQEIALGDMDSWTYEAYDFIQIEDIILKKDDLLGEYAVNAVPIVKLLITKNGKCIHKELNFGAMCIMESMADMFERKIYGRSKAKEYVQYDICEKIWEYLFRGTVQYDLLFRCSEYSLMYDNPGQMFYAAIKMLSETNTEKIKTEEIDSFFKSQVKPYFMDDYNGWFSEMMSQFNALVPKNNKFASHLKDYVGSFCQEFNDLRNKQALYFSKLYNSEPAAIKFIISSLVGVACPLVISNNNEVYGADTIPGNALGMEEYAAFYALYSMFGIQGKDKCELFEICKKNNEGIVSSSCFDNPLETGKKEKLCTLGQLLYMWQAKAVQLI